MWVFLAVAAASAAILWYRDSCATSLQAPKELDVQRGALEPGARLGIDNPALGIDKSRYSDREEILTDSALDDSALDDEACARTWIASRNIFPYGMTLVDAVRIVRNAGWPMPPCVERFAARVL